MTTVKEVVEKIIRDFGYPQFFNRFSMNERKMRMIECLSCMIKCQRGEWWIVKTEGRKIYVKEQLIAEVEE